MVKSSFLDSWTVNVELIFWQVNGFSIDKERFVAQSLFYKDYQKETSMCCNTRYNQD